jgi:phage terminase large subunit GpA-like protein
MSNLVKVAKIDHSSDQEWLVVKTMALPSEISTKSPSEWAEEERYLPAGVTKAPGKFRFSLTPYLREILDCLDVRSSVRSVTFMKGSQVGATTGLLDNAIGYFIKIVKTAPLIFLTASLKMAIRRLTKDLIPMIDQSGLRSQIQSSDKSNKRKTGATDSLLEWVGGGSLTPLGANNPDGLRMIPSMCLFGDECDAWPISAGIEGSPLDLARGRMKTYWEVRKEILASTPLIKGQSLIEENFLLGDQCYYEVPCQGCGRYQSLKFNRIDKETGEETGLKWERKNGRVVPGSVRYVCRFSDCGYEHTNAQKSIMLPIGKWVATAVPQAPDIRSFHLSSLYSPAGMFSWEAIVLKWEAAWDVETNKPRDLRKLQEFYNTVLGKTYELRGEKLTPEAVSKHRRHSMRPFMVPNKFALKHTGGLIGPLICTVDVHKDNIDVVITGWAKGPRAFVIHEAVHEGTPKNLDDPCWSALRELQERLYYSDDDKVYAVALTLIDSGYGHSTNEVYKYCQDSNFATYAIKGFPAPASGKGYKEFVESKTTLGGKLFNITVDHYKDNWSWALRREWEEAMGHQPASYYNILGAVKTKRLNQLTAETKREKVEKNGQRKGYEWYRPSGSRNELWDHLVYAAAGLDILAWDYCMNQWGGDFVNWPYFWETAINQQLFFREKSSSIDQEAITFEE